MVTAALATGAIVWTVARPDREAVVATDPLRSNPPERPAHPPRPPEDYVGSAKCAECHAEIAAAYRHHPMGHSARAVATLPSGRVQDAFSPAPGLEYRVERKDGRVFHHEIARDDRGTVLYDQAVPVEFAIGSGKRGRSYLTNRDGMLFVSPIAWYAQKNRWDQYPGYKPFHNDRFERRALDLCLRCHVGRVAPRPETPNAFVPPVFREISIGCENCHGPGKRHVEFHLAAAPAGGDPIVNPAKLAPELREAVCNQCHLSGLDTIPRYGRTAYDFRPGMHLADVLAVFVESSPRGGVRQVGKAVGHVGQMRSSRCFQSSAGKLGCISCHDPHSTPPLKQRAAYYRERCARCHREPESGCALPLADRNDSGKGNSCIACHMPRFQAADVPHTTQTDHRILREPAAGGEVRTSPHTAAFENVEIFGAEAAGLSQAARSRARHVLMARIAAQTRDASAAGTALRELKSVLKTVPDDPLVLDALARCCATLKRPDEAADYWKRALRAAPHDELILVSLAQHLQRQGRLREALALYDRFVAQNRWMSDVHFRRSHILAQLQQGDEALAAAKRAAELDPSVPGHWEWLAELQRRRGEISRGLQLRETARRLQALRSRSP